MIPSLRVQVARASAAGWRSKAATVLPTVCHSFLRARPGSTRYALLSVKRSYATEATLLAEDMTAKLPAKALEADDDISDDRPLFSSLKGKIHQKTLKALTETPFKYEHMSVVQGEVLPMLPGLSLPRKDNPESVDLLVKARTGTGKTIAFLVPAIEARIRQLEGIASSGEDAKVGQQYARDNVGALVISPTRELATQIVTEAQKLTAHHRFSIPMMVGGLSRSQQIYDFRRGSKDILVATPGRLTDLLQDQSTGVAQALKNTPMLILDEADTLLDMGFRDDIERIMRYLPDSANRQTMLFSATVSDAIKQIADRHMAPNHKFVNCVSEDTSEVHAHIPQYHTIVSNPAQQIPHLMRLMFHDQLEHRSKSKIIVFLPTTKYTQLVTDLLYKLHRTVLPEQTQLFEIHSKKAMNSRVRASDGFRNSKRPSILITSDVSARGVDYPGVTRVIQFGVPSQPAQYVHRVGRTGRGGSTVGRGDLILHPWEYEYVRRHFSHLPLKPLTVKHLQEEIKTMIAPQDPTDRPHRATLKHADLEQNVTESLSRLDPEAVSETMLSLLGFYASLVKDFRIDISRLIEELGGWTTLGLGQSQAPTVPPRLLAKLGVGSRSHRGGSFGRKTEWRDEAPRYRNDGQRSYGDRDSPRRKPWDNPNFRGSRTTPRDSDDGFRPRAFGNEGGFNRNRDRDFGGYKGDRDSGFKRFNDRNDARGRSRGYPSRNNAHEDRDSRDY